LARGESERRAETDTNAAREREVGTRAPSVTSTLDVTGNNWDAGDRREKGNPSFSGLRGAILTPTSLGENPHKIPPAETPKGLPNGARVILFCPDWNRLHAPVEPPQPIKVIHRLEDDEVDFAGAGGAQHDGVEKRRVVGHNQGGAPTGDPLLLFHSQTKVDLHQRKAKPLDKGIEHRPFSSGPATLVRRNSPWRTSTFQEPRCHRKQPA